MLVLGRREGESIVIRDTTGNLLVEIVLVDIDRGKARIGIKADPSLPVNRGEIDQRAFPAVKAEA